MVADEKLQGKIAAPARKGRRAGRCLVVWFALFLAGWGGLPCQAAATEEAPDASAPERILEARKAAFAALDGRYQLFLKNVSGLITEAELDYFLRLREDFRRDRFMEEFWEPRDPDPRARGNSLRDRWLELGGRTQLLPAEDKRFLALLLNGPPTGWSLPDGRFVTRCFSKTHQLEIWFYSGSERVGRDFALIFLQRLGERPWETYRLGDFIDPARRTGRLPTTEVAALCADELLSYSLGEIRLIGDYEGLLEKVLGPPLPSLEWLASLGASSTDLPAGVASFEISPEVSFPARRGSRTEVRVVVPIRRSENEGASRPHLFELDGEVLRQGDVFETFHYRFEGSTSGATLPLGFQRYLRPGEAEIRVLVHDVLGDRYGRAVLDLEIPKADDLPEHPAETQAVVASRSLELFEPGGEFQSGRVRFQARARQDFDKVTFLVDDRPVLSKRNPPYSVELDLGEEVAPHRVRVVGYVGEREVATDQLWLNEGPRRFRVRLVEPRPGGLYPESATARAIVETPASRRLERLELLLDGQVVASFAGPPFVQELEWSAADAKVVEARAVLDDGTVAEDVVVLQGASPVAAIEVRLAELYPLVLDESGAPVVDLGREAFRVREGGEERALQLFAPAGEGPVELALLVDRSISMAERLPLFREAALELVDTLLERPEDRLAVFSFAERFEELTSFGAEVEGPRRALAGLTARGRTALYDALAQGLLAFDENRGTAALVLYTDGHDEISELDFPSIRETARARGIPIYFLVEEASLQEPGTSRQLEELAEVTGGRVLSLRRFEELGGAFRRVVEELRARYTLGFEPAGEPGGDRSVTVEVAGRQLRVVLPEQYRFGRD